MRSRKNSNVIQLQLCLAGQRVNLHYAVNLVPEKLHPVGHTVRIGRKDLQDISPHPEGTAVKVHVIAGILNIDQLVNHLIPVFLHARTKRNDHLLIVDRRAQTINAGNRSHYDHILPLGKSCRSGVAKLINLVINGGIFLNIGVRGGHIGLRLVIIIIADKIFYGIFRKKFLHLPIKLCRQRFVVGNDQSRLVQCLNDIGHGKGLTGTGNSKQRLKLIALPEALHKFGNGLGLVTGWGVFRY